MARWEARAQGGKNDMDAVFELLGATKAFGRTTALDRIELSVGSASVVGLIGRNGSGKTTLLNLIAGLVLPTSGLVRTFGHDTAELRAEELAQIGMVHQEGGFFGWMSVRQQLDYVASFYPRWDKARESRLVEALELDPSSRVGALSPGNRQKLALVAAVALRPSLLLLDEPVAAMDAIVRARMLDFLLDIVREDGCTTVVSSHVLRDIEGMIDRIVCLDRGRIRADAPLDDLMERYAEWIVGTRNGALPERFAESFVLHQEGDGRRARILVRDGSAELERFRSIHDVEVEVRPLNLEHIFPLLLKG